MKNPFSGEEKYATGDYAEFLSYAPYDTNPSTWEKGYVVGQVQKDVVLISSSGEMHKRRAGTEVRDISPVEVFEAGTTYTHRNNSGATYKCLYIDPDSGQAVFCSYLTNELFWINPGSAVFYSEGDTNAQ